MADVNGIGDFMPWAASGGAGLLGRIMYLSKQAKSGVPKPFSWAIILDVPVALGTGWMALGLATWLNLPHEAKISLAIFFGYLGPYGIDTVFAAWADRFKGGSNDKTTD